MASKKPDDLALVGRKECGCVVAVDLDVTKANKAELLRRGYIVSIEKASVAIELINTSRCEH